MSLLSSKLGKCALAGLAGVALVLTLPAAASALDLSGKTVKWIVPFKEGGGSDTIARLMQPYLKAALPGNPTVLILNKPGGGSVTAANKFSRSGKTDGTELMIASSSTLMPAMLGAKTVKYDPTEWRALVGLPRGTVLYVNPKTSGIVGGGKDPVSDVNKLREAKILHGLKTSTGAELLDLVGFEILNIPVKPVFGLSTGKSRQAFLRGETTTNSDGTGPYLKKLKEQSAAGEASIVYSYGQQNPDGTVVRDPDLPDLPTLWEVYKQVSGKDLSGAAHGAMFATANVKVALSKSIVLPKGTSDEVVAAYITAFKKVVANPDVQKALKKAVGSMPIAFGKDVETAIAAGTKLSPEAMSWIKTLLKSKYNTEL